MTRLVIRDADLDGRRVDVTCTDGLVTSVDRASACIDVAAGVDEIDARGGAVLPGLHDHHIHLLAAAAALRSVQVGPPDVQSADQLIAALRNADRLLPPGEWLRAVGYHESVAGAIDGDWLDALGIGRPIRIQHRTGALWILNTAGLFELGLGVGGPDQPSESGPGPHVERNPRGRPTGRLFRADELVRTRRSDDADASGSARPQARITEDLALLGRRLVGYGITGVTDLTPTTNASSIALLATARRSGALPIGLTVTGGVDLSRAAAPELPRGPIKIVIDDHALPPLDWVVAEFTRARATGRTIAVHSVTRESLILAMAAWQDVGAVDGDRIEHGAVIPVELLDDVARLGLSVVTQPSFVRERGDHYLTDVEPDDVAHLWRCGSLMQAGIGVAFGSDAPYGDLDPWAAISTAADRRTTGGAVLGPDERVTLDRALRAFAGTADDPRAARTVTPGQPADLCVLDRTLAEQLLAPSADAVVATIVAGVAVFHR